MSAADRLEFLGIKGAQYAYYCLGETFMSDFDFDIRYRRFEEKFPNLTLIGSAIEEDYTQAEKAYAKLFLGKYEKPDENGLPIIRRIK